MMRGSASAPMSMIDDHRGGGINQGWNSPIPYLFGGLALMLALVATALLILACSFRKSSSTNGNDSSNTRRSESRSSGFEGAMSPKIVVIMAGDHNPTFLAKPLPSPMVPYGAM